MVAGMGEAPVDQRYRSHLEGGDVDVSAAPELSRKENPCRAIVGRGVLDEECGTKHHLSSEAGKDDILTPRRNSGSMR